jgi:TolB protein
VAAGACPDLSPDGTRLAFNTQNAKSAERHIAVADVATGKATRLPGIPGDNCYGPAWSPDGALLIFQIFTGQDWKLGIIGAEGANFRYFTPKAPTGGSLYSIAWAPDSQSFYAQDLDTLYHFALEGTLRKKWSITKLIPGGGFNSGARFSVSPDGDTLLLEVDMDEDVTRKDWDGPPPAIWSFNLTTAKATRLTAKGLFAWEPRWVDAGAFLCILQPASAKEPSIYRVSADGKMRQPLVKNAREPSASR